MNTELNFNRRSSDKATARAQYRALPVAVYAPPPDWRNLGILARSLILVFLGIIVVTLHESNSDEFMHALAAHLSFAMWPIFAVMIVAYALSPWLAKLQRWQWISILMSVVILCALLLPAAHLGVRLKQALIAALTLGAVFLYLDLRGKAFSPALTEARLQALQARIRPHFLFNSLNSVLGLMRREPRKAEDLLQDLAELFRALMRDNRELMPLQDEVRLTEQYLALEQQRMGVRLNVVWQIEHMPVDALVPPLILQPLVENAVYHGIEPSNTVGNLEINIFYRRKQIGIVVRNPYHLADSGHHSGNKMAVGNIRERLLLHFDSEASLTAGIRGSLYEVSMRMPYRKANPTQLSTRL